MSTKQYSACFYFKDAGTTEIYTLSLHDALPISDRDEILSDFGAFRRRYFRRNTVPWQEDAAKRLERSEEHTSELQSRRDLVCRLLLEKKKKKKELKSSLTLAFFADEV